MRVPYPKTSEELAVFETILKPETSGDEAVWRSAQLIDLQDRLTQWLNGTEMEEGQIFSVLCALLVQGRIEIAWQDRIERLELGGQEERWTRSQVAALFEDTLLMIRDTATPDPRKSTARIVAQVSNHRFAGRGARASRLDLDSLVLEGS